MDLSVFGYPESGKDTSSGDLNTSGDWGTLAPKNNISVNIVSTNPNLKHGKSYDSVFPVDIWNDNDEDKTHITPSKQSSSMLKRKDKTASGIPQSDLDWSVEVSRREKTIEQNSPSTQHSSNQDIDLIQFDEMLEWSHSGTPTPRTIDLLETSVGSGTSYSGSVDLLSEDMHVTPTENASKILDLSHSLKHAESNMNAKVIMVCTMQTSMCTSIDFSRIKMSNFKSKWHIYR